MSRLLLAIASSLVFAACGGAQPAETDGDPNSASPSDGSASDGENPSGAAESSGDLSGEDFNLKKSSTAKSAQGVSASKLKPTKTEAKMKLIVQDKETGPIPDMVVSLTDPEGKKYYTEETDAVGYAEVLVPVGKRYIVTYLTLGKTGVEKLVDVPNEEFVNIKLTLNYKRIRPAPPVINEPPPDPGVEIVEKKEPRLILDGVVFDTAKATLKKESFPHLDIVVEFLTYKKNARIELSGHTDNVGQPKKNKKLSQNRAKACREYLISKGIDGSRIEAVGFGEEKPIASNKTADGRQKNRRTEAREL